MNLGFLVGRMFTGIALGCFGGLGSEASSFTSTQFALTMSSAHAAGCVAINPTEQVGYSVAKSNVAGAEAAISVSSSTLRIDCSDNAYTVAIEAPNSNCGGTGQAGISQVGWIKSTTSVFSMVDYRANLAGGTGCGRQDFPVNLSSGSHTFQTVSQPGGGCGSYQWYYFLDNVVEDIQCADWGFGNQLTEFGERLGSTNQMGNIGFWWIKYCTSVSCTPSSDPGTPPWPARLRCGLNQSGGCGYNGRIGWAGVPVPDQSWPNFYVCDVSLSTSTC